MWREVIHVEIFQTAMQELAINSPYAFIIIALMFFFSNQNKNSLKQINSIFQSSLEEIRQSHQQSLLELRKTIEYLTNTTKTL